MNVMKDTDWLERQASPADFQNGHQHLHSVKVTSSPSLSPQYHMGRIAVGNGGQSYSLKDEGKTFDYFLLVII